MSTSWYHAQSSARKWGGEPEEYLPVHLFIDSSKEVIGDVRHRAMYHHTSGTFLAEKIFGPTLMVTSGYGAVKRIPTRLIAERHIIEDLGWLPAPADYLRGMPLAPWMGGRLRRTLPLTDLITPKESHDG